MYKTTNMYLIGQKLKDMKIMKDKKNLMMKIIKKKSVINNLLIGIAVKKNLTNLVKNLLLRNLMI